MQYTMKADPGYLGSRGFLATYSKPPFDFCKMIKRVLIALGIIVIMFTWLRLTEQRDTKLDNKFDNCYNSYDNSLEVGYVAYMQNCMN